MSLKLHEFMNELFGIIYYNSSWYTSLYVIYIIKKLRLV